MAITVGAKNNVRTAHRIADWASPTTMEPPKVPRKVKAGPRPAPNAPPTADPAATFVRLDKVTHANAPITIQRVTVIAGSLATL